MACPLQMSTAAPQFVHHDLRLLNPAFSSPLLDVLTELELLRRLQLTVTTPQPVFVQLKRVFHLLESLASARIEGNHTTLADYVEEKVAGDGSRADAIQEIRNLERAMDYVEAAVQPGGPITLALIRELHQMAVQGLKREGDKTPGAWRTTAVSIAQAVHRPPEAVQVPGYMDELAAFINRADAPKYDLMKVALAHHRFAWVHPFTNGNGRVVRLLTYALLIKYGFKVGQGDEAGRLLNPAAVFCTDRQRYYDMLAAADAGTDAALEAWCVYVLDGVQTELQKLDQLADYKHFVDKVLWPAINYAHLRGWTTQIEDRVLTTVAAKGVVKAGDLGELLPTLTATQRTYQIRKLVDRGLLQPLYEGARQYVVGFASSELLRGVIKALTDEGLVPAQVREPAAG